MDRMLAGLSLQAFNEWAAFYEQDPWGDQRADVRAGIVASTLVNTLRGANPPAQPQDFMLYTARPEIQITDTEIERRIEAFMGRYRT